MNWTDKFVTKTCCATCVKIREYPNFVSILLAYFICAVSSLFSNSILGRLRITICIHPWSVTNLARSFTFQRLRNDHVLFTCCACLPLAITRASLKATDQGSHLSFRNRSCCNKVVLIRTRWPTLMISRSSPCSQKWDKIPNPQWLLIGRTSL